MHTGKKATGRRRRDWSDTNTSEDMLSTHQKLEEAGQALPQRICSGCGLDSTLISDFWPPELGEDRFRHAKSNEDCGNLLL